MWPTTRDRPDTYNGYADWNSSMKPSHKTRSILASGVYYKLGSRNIDILNEPYDYKCFNVKHVPMWPATQDKHDTYLGYIV